MNRMQNILAVTVAEMRLTRRLLRYWIFLGLAYLTGFLVYLYYALIHAFFSSYSATAALIGPRFLAGFLGVYSVLVLMTGIIFLGFDVRNRDERERMVEVLDSRPMTNLELLIGRFFGILLPLWVPIALLVLLLQCLGLLLPALGVPVGEPMEVYSLITYIVLMALPAMAFSLSLVFLVTLLVRNRLIAALVLAVLLGANLYANYWLPLTITPIIDLTGSYMVNFPSEIMPGMTDLPGGLQRLGVAIAAVGLLMLAAAVHPRLDGGSRSSKAVSGLVMVAMAIGLMSVAVHARIDWLEQLESWRIAHQARSGEPIPDIVDIKGEVIIEPGKRLAIDISMRVQARPGQELESALFSLNPGLQVTAVAGADGEQLAYSHTDGLLEIELGQLLIAGEEEVIRLSAEGLPDNQFSYLDAARTPEALSPREGVLFMLGFERALFDRRFVALMPGLHWLPAAGTDVGRDDPRIRERDFFNVELTVTAPQDWLVAGPGRRYQMDDGGFRFAPPAPVSEVCLIASRFVSRSAEIDGVQMELLVHAKHTRNLTTLAEAAPEIESRIEEMLGEAREAGLAYPYDGFSLVEVPTLLRGFSGGWRLDTALAPPAMVLMRESSLPTARFDVPFRKPESFRDQEGGVPRAKRVRVERFFLNDFTGGNLLIGAARSFFYHQTAAHGAEALALNFVLEDLTTHVVTGTRGYFSAHLFNPELGQMIARSIQSYSGAAQREGNFAATLIEVATSRPEVWNAVLDIALKDLDPVEDPQRTIDALTLKAGSLAQSLYDELGAEGMGKLLAELRHDYSGRSFDIGKVMAAGDTVEAELGQLLSDWLTTTQLPGFVGDGAEVLRLPDRDDGSARYQLLAAVRNDEPVPGVIRLQYRIGSEDDREVLLSEPIRINGQSTTQWGVVVSKLPEAVFVEPYLSLNRDRFRILMQPPDGESIVDQEPFEGTRSLPWVLPGDQITVDDLDQGFNVDNGDESSGWRIGARSSQEAELDQGLPTQEWGKPSVWSRAFSPTSWGKYRHTFVYIQAGSGDKHAAFTTDLSRTDTWQLEIHLPHKERFPRYESWGTWHLEIIGPDGQHQAELEATGAPRGWNLVGSYDLEGGEVTVKLSDQNEGDIVIADAIRWTPAAVY
jgi:ABC-type transport system involved in multi-copper enzyme maturation permease subunit